MVRHSWRTHLKAAADERDVVAIVARYLGEWGPAEIRALPRGAWPAHVDTPRAVIDHGVELSRLHAAHHGGGASLAHLQEMLLFFTHAAVALTRLASVRAEAVQPAQ